MGFEEPWFCGGGGTLLQWLKMSFFFFFFKLSFMGRDRHLLTHSNSFGHCGYFV